MADVETQHGYLVALTERMVGDQLDATASIGATTLSLNDASDFSEDGGQLTFGGNVYTYDTVDLDADTIHLTSATTTAGSVGDSVTQWDTDSNVVVSERIALVSVDDQEGDPASVTIDYTKTPTLAQATLVAGQSVTIASDADSDEWYLWQVHGKNNAALNRSTTGYMQFGIDNFDGTVTGLEVDTTGSPTQVRLIAESPGGGVRVQAKDRSTYLAIAASAFNVSSDEALKTDIGAAPDALAIMSAAPAYSWRYMTDAEGTVRFGPLANDLPASMTTADGDHLTVDLARMVGVLWRAVEQLQARITDLEEGAR